MNIKAKQSLFFPIIIFILLTLELWLLTLGRKQFGVMWSPLVLLGCGMISGIGFLVFFYDKKITLQEFNWDWKKRALMFLVSFFGIWKCGDMLRTIIRNEPIDFYNFYLEYFLIK